LIVVLFGPFWRCYGTRNTKGEMTAVTEEANLPTDSFTREVVAGRTAVNFAICN
jgi:hypothetical protein